MSSVKYGRVLSYVIHTHFLLCAVLKHIKGATKTSRKHFLGSFLTHLIRGHNAKSREEVVNLLVITKSRTPRNAAKIHVLEKGSMI